MSATDNQSSYRHHQMSTIWTSRHERQYEGDIEEIAKYAHTVNMAFSSLSDCSVNDQTPWSELPEETRAAKKADVLELIRNPLHIQHGAAGQESSHEAWCRGLESEGWTYAAGPKNVGKKTHPCLVPYSQLREADRVKDSIYTSTILAGVWILAEKVLTTFRSTMTVVTRESDHFAVR